MKRNNQDDNQMQVIEDRRVWGCLFYFLAFLGGLVIAAWIDPKGRIAFFVIAIVAMFLIVAGVKYLIRSVKNFFANRKERRIQRVENRKIVDLEEPKPPTVRIANETSYVNAEEEHVNASFREFLKAHNEYVTANSKVNYLRNKVAALRSLKREKEAAQLAVELEKNKEDLRVSQEKRSKKFMSKCNTVFLRVPEVKNAFSDFATMLPNDRVPLVGDFFQSPQIRVIQVGPSSALMFTPCYVLNYTGPSNKIKLIKYEKISAHTHTYLSAERGERKSTDEIARTGYLYETMDGRRDLRYRYDNNPEITYFYRGRVVFECDGFSFERTFSNKSSTEQFQAAYDKYNELLDGEYKQIVKRLLSHDAMLENAKDIADAIARKNEEIKRTIDEEKKREERNRREQQEKKAKETIAVKMEEQRLAREKLERENARLKAEQKMLEEQKRTEERKRKAAEERERILTEVIVSRDAQKSIKLSDEERRLILELRRKKERTERRSNEVRSSSVTKSVKVVTDSNAKRGLDDKRQSHIAKDTPVKNDEMETTEYRLVDYDDSKIRLTLGEDSRRITNNIFKLTFSQEDATADGKESAEYEVFVVDEKGHVISSVATVLAEREARELSHKVTLSLSARESFSKDKKYYVVCRYKGADTDVLAKVQYQISIDFASDFDF